MSHRIPSLPVRRRGSILIMVVALLVLIALIATAMISTTTADRFGSVQHQNNVQVDLLVLGAKEIVKAEVMKDLYGTVAGVANPVYRPGFAVGTGDFINVDAPVNFRPMTGEAQGSDTWLAPRTPVTWNSTTFTSGTNLPLWPSLTKPMSVPFFSSPARPWVGTLSSSTASLRIAEEYNSPTITFSPRTSIYEDPGNPGAYVTPYLIPTATPRINGVSHPAFYLPIYSNGALINSFTFLAADADADGIADSMLQEVPIGEVNGVKYYYAFRIIDHNSAINVNTAFSSWRDFHNKGTASNEKGDVTVNLALFPTNIGLVEFFGEAFTAARMFGKTLTESDFNVPSLSVAGRFNDPMRFLKHRLLGVEGAYSTINLWMPDGVANHDTDTFQPDRPHEEGNPLVARSDFRYATLAEAMWMDLGRRLGSGAYGSNPSAVSASTPAAPPWTAFTFHEIGRSDEFVLAYPFAIRSEYAPSMSLDRRNSNSLIERLLPNSLILSMGGAASFTGGAYNPAAAGRWFFDNFNTLDEELRFSTHSTSTADAQSRPLRSILTTLNPTSNLMPRPVGSAGMPVLNVSIGTYALNYTLPASTANNLIGPAMIPPASIQFDPADSPPKASLNTSDYARLFRAFWAVMQEDWSSTGNIAPNAGTPFSQELLEIDAGTISWPAQCATETALADSPVNPYYGMKWNEPTSSDVAVFDVRAGLGASAREAIEIHPAKMFRSSLRNTPEGAPPASAAAAPTLSTPIWSDSGGLGANLTRLSADQMLILRAAIAAANAQEMRDPDDAIRPVDLDLFVNRTTATPAGTQVRARVFGLERQPFITEIYAQTATNERRPDPAVVGGFMKNPRGYVAIEIYNPHDVPIDLRNCVLAIVTRVRATGDPSYAISTKRLATAVSNVAGTVPPWPATVIPKKGYLVLENYSATGIGGANDAKYRPKSLAVTGGLLETGQAAAPTWSLGSPGSGEVEVNVAFVPELAEVLGKEMVLMRPLDAGYDTVQNPNALTYMAPTGGEVVNVFSWQQMAPLDSFDFTGCESKPRLFDNSTYANVWHYARANAKLPGDPPNASRQWHFVYPGRYNATQSWRATESGRGILNPRQQGVVRASHTSNPSGYGWDETIPSGMQDPANLDEGRAMFAAKRPGAGYAFDITIGQSGPATLVENPYATYPNTFPIQLLNDDQPGPSSLDEVGNQPTYPYGGFARVGDVLSVPFIGSYWITLTSELNNRGKVLEINPVTMDAAMAEDTDVKDDPRRDPHPSTGSYRVTLDTEQQSREQVGRFCAIQNMSYVSGSKTVAGTPYWGTAQDPSFVYGDFPPPGTTLTATNRSFVRYHWTTDIFDYFTVLNPANDFAPNVRPDEYFVKRTFNSGAALPVSPPAFNTPPVLIKNTDANILPNQVDEENEPVSGLINLNTASAKVLSAVPWFPHDVNSLIGGAWFDSGRPDFLKFDAVNNAAGFASSGGYIVSLGSDNIDDNYQLAEAIVVWRDGNLSSPSPGNGPFHSIYDLYRVPAFREAQRLLLEKLRTSGQEPTAMWGDLSPFSLNSLAVRDFVANDYEEQYLLLTRVSNLLTTRSDVFTAYILVQGWRNAGTATPELVVQRRAAMILDRSRVSQSRPGEGRIWPISIP